MEADPALPSAQESVEALLLGAAPHLTSSEVADRAGVPLELAEQLWRLLGFPHAGEADRAFTDADVEALRLTRDLTELGILGADSQAALVRTWGRSFARLAEWETTLLAEVATAAPDPAREITGLAESVLPRVERLQSYVWRRHLASAASRALADATGEGTTSAPLAVCFVDIVGYTSTSRNLDERELVDWLEQFEDLTTGLVVDHGGRIIKTIGDEVLFVTDRPADAADIALRAGRAGRRRGRPLPGGPGRDRVRRRGESPGRRLRPDGQRRVPADLGRAAGHGAGRPGHPRRARPAGRQDDQQAGGSPYAFRRSRRTSVKGYARLQPWVLRRAGGSGE